METRHFIKHCMASALTAAMLVCLSLASCENKPKVTGGDIYQLYSLKNTNIEEPAWRENIVKLVGLTRFDKEHFVILVVCGNRVVG